jgi:hypothetical protein
MSNSMCKQLYSSYPIIRVNQYNILLRQKVIIPFLLIDISEMMRLNINNKEINKKVNIKFSAHNTFLE